jgi:predicted DNA-binding protein (MmcQ/YjbR family)
MARLGALCLALPEAYEEETWGEATFRVRRKIFVMGGDHEGRTTVSLKAAPGEQEALLAEGGPYFFPAYVGTKGWVGIDLRHPRLDWGEVGELVTESYRLVAPKRLVQRYLDRTT